MAAIIQKAFVEDWREKLKRISSESGAESSEVAKLFERRPNRAARIRRTDQDEMPQKRED